MKEFFVGLLTLLILAAMVGAFYLLMPFILLLGIFLQAIVYILLGIFSVWLVGKLILMLFDKLRERKSS